LKGADPPFLAAGGYESVIALSRSTPPPFRFAWLDNALGAP